MIKQSKNKYDYKTFIFHEKSNDNIFIENNKELIDFEIIELASENYSQNLLQFILSTLKDPVDKQKDFIIFHLNRDRLFTKNDLKNFTKKIDKVITLRGDVLVTDPSYFCCSIPIDCDISWVESIRSASIVIIFKSFYDRFTRSLSLSNETIYERITRLSNNKFVTAPFRKGITATEQNKVKNEFNKGIDILEASNKLYYIYKGFQQNVEKDMDKILVDNISIPTYIINLAERTERHAHIMNQFKDKEEFNIEVVKACKHPIGAVGLWISIKEVIKLALKNDDDIIIICEDDHEFTNQYSKVDLFKNVFEGYKQSADYINGGTSIIDKVVPITKNRYWANETRATQFMIIFKKFFKKILEYEFTEDVVADIVLSNIADTKMILFPFISKQHNFGYSDVTPEHNDHIYLVDEMFSNTERRLCQIRDAFEKYGF